MSFHNKPNYQIPELIEALKAHRLPHDTPSQLADSFRIGWMACRELAQADSVQEDAARYRFLRDGEWRGTDLEPFIRLQLNTLWDAKIDAARAARGAAEAQAAKQQEQLI